MISKTEKKELMTNRNYGIIQYAATTILCLILSATANCQNLSDCTDSAIDSYMENEENLTGVFNYIPVSGIRFINSNWRKGEVLLEDGKKITNVYLNYNLINYQLFWLRDKDYKQVTLDKTTVKQFKIYEKENIKEMSFKKIYFKPWYRLSFDYEYLQVLAEGAANIYVFRKANINVSTNELIKINEYYFRDSSNHLSNFILRRYVLYKLVGQDKPVLKKIIRTNHLRIRKENDMIKAMELFNKEKSGS